MGANSVIIKLALEDKLTPELKQAQKELEELSTSTLKLDKNLTHLKNDKRSLLSGDIKSEIKEIKQLQDEVKKLEAQQTRASTPAARKEAKGQLDRAKIALTRAVNAEINKQNELLKAQRSELALLAAKTQKKLTDELRQRRGITEAVHKETEAVKSNTDTRYEEDAVRRSASNTIVRQIRQLESLAVGYFALSRAYKSTLGVGVELNRQYQNMELGLSALLAAQSDAIRVNGKSVTAIEKFREAQKQTKDVLDNIKKASVETPASFQQMVGFYQQAIGAAMSSNGAFGATIQEVSDNTILLTKRMSSLASTIGLEMPRVDEEIRSLMNASASTDSILSSIIFGSPAAANEAIRKARKQTDGLTKLLEEKLKSFDILFNESTYDKEKNFLLQELDKIRKAAAQPLFEDLRKSMKELTAYLAKNGSDIVASIKNVYEIIKVLISYVDDALIAFIAWKIIPSTIFKPMAIGLGAVTRGMAGAKVGAYALRTAMVSLSRSLALVTKRFLPLLALEGFYQAYLYFTDQQIDKEKELGKATERTALMLKRKELYYRQAELRQDYGLYEQDKKTLSGSKTSNRRGYNAASARMTSYKEQSRELSKQIQANQKLITQNETLKQQSESQIKLLQKKQQNQKLLKDLQDEYFNKTASDLEKIAKWYKETIDASKGDPEVINAASKLYDLKFKELEPEKRISDAKVDLAKEYQDQLFALKATELEKLDKWLEDELKRVKDNEEAKQAIYKIYANKRQNLFYKGGSSNVGANGLPKYFNDVSKEADAEIAKADALTKQSANALENSLANSINRGIQDALNQEFDFTNFIVQMSSAVGAAILSQEVAKAVSGLFNNVGAAGSQSGNPYAAAAGAALIGIGALYSSRDASAYNQEQQNRIQNELQAMNDKLSTQIQIMEKGGLKGTALFNELSKAVQTFKLNTRVYEEKSYRTGYDQLFNKPTYTKRQLQDTGAALLDFGAVVVDLSDEIESVTNSFKDLYDDVTGSTFFKDQNVANAKSTLQNAGFNTDAFAASLFVAIKKLNNTTYSKSDLTRIFTTGSQAEQQQVLDSYRAIFGDQSTKENILNLADAIQTFGESLTSTTNNIESAVTSVSGINDSIQGVIDDINNFGASGVQSAQFYAQRYSDQLAAARSALSAYQASGSDADLEAYNTSVSDLTSVASNYKEAIAATYKSSAVTQNVLQTITGDLKPLQDATVSLQERMLDELKQINIATTSTAISATSSSGGVIDYGMDKPVIALPKEPVSYFDLLSDEKKGAMAAEAERLRKEIDEWYRTKYNIYMPVPDSINDKSARLRVLESSGFKTGGFTPNVGINTIAGVVHGGEYVAPAYQVQQYPQLFNNLNADRKGYKSGGLVDNSEMLNVMRLMVSYLRQIAEKDGSVNISIDEVASAIERQQGLSA